MTLTAFAGTVVLPDRVIEGGHVLVEGGKIVRVAEGMPSGDFVGGEDTLVLPGAIDAQVHSRTQRSQGDFLWTTRSAAAGGVTTIIDMPYDEGDLICNAERLRRKADEAAGQARVDFGLYGTIHPADGDTRIDEMVAAGAVGFKFSTFNTDPERFPRIPPHVLAKCFARIARHGLIAGVHNEHDEFVRAAMQEVRVAGLTDWSAHERSRPALSEALAMAEIYEIGAATGCASHVVHCSIGRGYEMCAAYRTQGYETTVEACIHYLVLTNEDDVARIGARGKVNPPIRSRGELEAIWRHLAAGNVTVVSTDHSGWSEDRKDKADFLANSSGMPGLEVLYPLLLKGLEERGLGFSLAARLLAHNPAALFRISHVKGALAAGTDADIVLARKDPHIYDGGASGHNFVSWSAYEGIELPYRVIATYLRGQCVFEHGKSIGAPGAGRFVRPATAASPS